VELRLEVADGGDNAADDGCHWGCACLGGSGSEVVVEQKAKQEGRAEEWKARSTSLLAYR
jgi:hypothetical protein